MALDNEADGTAQNELATARSAQNQPPDQSGATPGSTTRQANAGALDVEKEMQRIRSETGRQLAQARREAEQARLAAEQVRQQNRALVMRDMSDVDRALYERDEAVNFARQTNAEREAERQERERLADLQAIANETGAPMEELLQAQSYGAAWQMGVAHMRKQTPTARKAEEERDEANSVYIGSGAPSTPATRREQKYDKMFQDRDINSYILALVSGE